MLQNTFAARAGRWSAANRKKAIFGWLAFVMLAVAIGSASGTKSPPPTTTARRRLRSRRQAGHRPLPRFRQRVGPHPRPSWPDLPRRRPARRRRPDREGRLELQDVQNVDSPYAKGNAARSAPTARRSSSTSRSRATTTRPRPRSTRSRPPSRRSAPITRRCASASSATRARARRSRSPSATTSQGRDAVDPDHIAILILAFGTLAAVGIPVLLALTAVFATLGHPRAGQPRHRLDQNVSSVVLLIGWRSASTTRSSTSSASARNGATGASEREALHTAAATSGRAVLVSGFTVIVAMAGMFLAGDNDVHRHGHRLDHGRRDGDDRLGHRRARRCWRGSATRSTRDGAVHRPPPRRRREPRLGLGPRPRPAPAARRAPSPPAAVLVALAIPAFGIHTANSGIDSLPRSSRS